MKKTASQQIGATAHHEIDIHYFNTNSKQMKEYCLENMDFYLYELFIAVPCNICTSFETDKSVSTFSRVKSHKHSIKTNGHITC